MAKWYYRCEVKGIQSFVMRGAKLLEIVGGSALIDALFSQKTDKHYKRSLLAQALHGILGSDSAVDVLYCAAGGATLCFDDPKSDDLLRTWVSQWPIWVEENLPSVHLIQAWVHEDEVQDNYEGNAVKALAERLAIARNLQHVELPQSTPLIDQGIRGGAASEARKLKSSDSSGQLIDRVTAKQLNAAQDRAKDGLQSRLRDRFFRHREELPFPTDHEELSGKNHAYLAVIHIDGNRIGRLLPHFTNIEDFANFARELNRVTLDAVNDACEALIPDQGEQIVLGRPIVVGGDDITAIVRADRAIDFTQRFINSFEKYSVRVASLPPLQGVVTKLTASAGIAFVRRNHPFKDALHLAEALCKFSKQAWRPTEANGTPPSLVAFQRVTSSLAELDRPSQSSPRFRLGPFYLPGEQREARLQEAGFVCLRDICILAKAAQHRSVSQGRLRTLVDWVSQSRELSHTQLNPARADQEWMRIDQLHRERERNQDFWLGEDGVLSALKGLNLFDEDDKDSWAQSPWLKVPFPFSDSAESRYASPWVDAYELIGAGAALPSDDNTKKV